MMLNYSGDGEDDDDDYKKNVPTKSVSSKCNKLIIPLSLCACSEACPLSASPAYNAHVQTHEDKALK